MIEIRILRLLFEGSLDWAKKCHHKAQIDFAILLVAQKVIIGIKFSAYYNYLEPLKNKTLLPISTSYWFVK